MRHLRPGVGLQAFQAQPNAVILTINLEDIHLNFLPDFKHIARVFHTMPCQLAHMNEAIRAPQIHECAKRLQIGHNPLAHIARLKRFEQLFFLFLLHFAHGGTLGENQAAAAGVHFHHFQLEPFANQALQTILEGLPRTAHQLGRRHETAQPTKGDNHTTFVVADDLAFKDFAAFGHLFSALPILLHHRQIDGDDTTPLIVLFGRNKDADRISDLDSVQIFARHLVNIARGDHGFSFETEVNQNFRIGFAHNNAFDDITRFGLAIVVLLLFEVLPHRR